MLDMHQNMHAQTQTAKNRHAPVLFAAAASSLGSFSKSSGTLHAVLLMW
jgi:hypothetical protein